MKSATRAWGLATILDTAPPGVRILSLDCFDTLLWRNMNLPIDLFADLPFAGGGMETRAWGESRARSIVPLKEGRHEVTIDEIYAQTLPFATAEERAVAIRHELDAEAAHCYGFAPTRDLMIAAKARGMTIIIVSDTYLSEPQLRGLISAAAGPAVAGMIDRIFCSCEYGVSKAGGLLTHVLAELGVSPSTILHVGDNPLADQASAEKLGIPSVHLQQFDPESEQRLRAEAGMAALIDADARVSTPPHQRHRAQIAMRQSDDPAVMLGHDVLGPLMSGFADWIAEEVAAQDAATGKRTRLLFLLRDGYLPGKAVIARHPDLADRCAMVELSRFTSAAASLTDAAAIERCVMPDLPGGTVAQFARQLLLDRDEVMKLSRLSRTQFARAMVEPPRVKRIAGRSADMRRRLFAHLASMGVEKGDSVMMVDLGYNGSVQNHITPVLQDELGLTVSGRYLLLRERTISGFDKRGFIDNRHYDLRLLNALSDSIALVEQLSTLAQGSVVDYRKDGTPVRKNPGVKGAQSAVREGVQAACLDYCAHADIGYVRAPASDTTESRRRMCTALLTRLLFLPMASEVALLSQFEHDVNMGTDDMVRMVDLDDATRGLRQRGLFYIKNAMRMYLPGELRQHGLPINLTNFTSRRFGLDLRKTDFDVGALSVPVMLMDGAGDHVVIDIDAIPTIDGYYQALIPVGPAAYTAGIQLGRIAEWVQVEETSFHEVDRFLESREHEDGRPATPMFEAMTEMAPGLHRCDGEGAFILVPPPSVNRGDDNLLLSFVFRPVVGKQAVAEEARKAA
jgi:FMN phosphatase YigB (HAD superfamily)